MSLPLLLALMVVMVWLGFSVIGQSEVTVEARHKAWCKRHASKASQPLFFTSPGYVEDSAATRVSVSPFLDNMSPPQSSHMVMGGSWDHTEIDLNGSPNLLTYAYAGLAARAAGIQNAYLRIKNLVGSLQNTAGRLLSDALSERTSLEQGVARTQEAQERARQENRRRAEQQIRDKRRIIRELEAKVRAAEEELKRARGQASYETDPERKSDLNEYVKISEGKLDRLKSELRDERDQLQALEESL